jgi:hypothetical protein
MAVTEHADGDCPWRNSPNSNFDSGTSGVFTSHDDFINQELLRAVGGAYAMNFFPIQWIGTMPVRLEAVKGICGL